jgi:multicomponent Na+:H+ antiporter subunit F
MFAVAAVSILVALALAITRAIQGPSVFDRLLAGNTIGTLSMMLLAVVGFINGRPEFLEVGLTYGVLNLVATLAILKFFRHGDLPDDPDYDADALDTDDMDMGAFSLDGKPKP